MIFFLRPLLDVDTDGQHSTNCASVSLIAFMAHKKMGMRLGGVTEEGGGEVVFCGGSGGCSVEAVATTGAGKEER